MRSKVWGNGGWKEGCSLNGRKKSESSIKNASYLKLNNSSLTEFESNNNLNLNQRCIGEDV